jgi:hypothetical protein
MDKPTAAGDVNRDGQDGLTKGQQVWLEHIQRCEAQSLLFSKYCAREGLSAKALYAVRKVLQAKGALPGRPTKDEPPRFAPVRLSQPSATLSSDILLPSGVQMRVSCRDVEQVAQLAAALARL